MSRVTLLTDFGTRDGYVAAMKGVISTLAPDAFLDDVSHDLAQGDIRGGMWALGRYWRLFPVGTVHLVVVDPGVGTDRLPLALEVDGRFVVAPDNGLVSRVLEDASWWKAVVIREERLAVAEPSATFHGRDVFAPAAGRLANGAALDDLGTSLSDPVRVEGPHPTRSRREAIGQVVRVDRFGNLITNLPGEWLGEYGSAEVAGHTLPYVSAYGYGEPGTPLALVNSDRVVELAVRNGSATEVLQIGAGAPVRLVR